MRHALLLPCLLACTAPDAAPDAASCDPAPWTAGATAEGRAGARVTLVDLDPAPPARFTNRWTVTIVDPDGQEVSAEGVTVTTFMPEHGHAGPEVSVIAGSDATFVLAPLELWMPGRWQIDVHVRKGDLADLVRFEVCVDP
jgi:hypothetical protein